MRDDQEDKFIISVIALACAAVSLPNQSANTVMDRAERFENWLEKKLEDEEQEG